MKYLYILIFFLLYSVSVAQSQVRPVNFNTVMADLFYKIVGSGKPSSQDGVTDIPKDVSPSSLDTEGLTGPGEGRSFLVDAEGEKSFKIECGPKLDNCKFKRNRVVRVTDRFTNEKMDFVISKDQDNKINGFDTWINPEGKKGISPTGSHRLFDKGMVVKHPISGKPMVVPAPGAKEVKIDSKDYFSPGKVKNVPSRF